MLTPRAWRVVLVCPHSISVSVVINYTNMAATSHVKLGFLNSKVNFCWIWTLSRRKGFPCLFWKKIKTTLILEKIALFVCIYGLNSHLKCSFKKILEKKHENLSLRSPSFVCCAWSVYRSAFIPRNLSCPEKFLVLRL